MRFLSILNFLNFSQKRVLKKLYVTGQQPSSSKRHFIHPLTLSKKHTIKFIFYYIFISQSQVLSTFSAYKKTSRFSSQGLIRIFHLDCTFCLFDIAGACPKTFILFPLAHGFVTSTELVNKLCFIVVIFYILP